MTDASDRHRGWVLVPTNPNINHVGAVFGPYPSKQAAQEALNEKDFPHPEDVLIRPLYVG